MGTTTRTRPTATTTTSHDRPARPEMRWAVRPTATGSTLVARWAVGEVAAHPRLAAA